jgi:hypothetical protein
VPAAHRLLWLIRMNVKSPAATGLPRPLPSGQPATPQVAAKKVQQTVADGFITRAELDDVEAVAAKEGEPYAKELLLAFAAVAEAKFSAANPEVQGFAARLVRMFNHPDPVTQVPATDVAQAALSKLWSNASTGGMAERRSIEERFTVGALSGMEAVIEATGLLPDMRVATLTSLATKASDADAMALVSAAATTGKEKLPDGKPASFMTLEQHRDLALALASNPKVSVSTVLAAAEQLNGYKVSWSQTQVRLRAEVMHAILQNHPDAKTANELAPQLRSVAFQGSDLNRDVIPLAENLLAHGASLGTVLESMNVAGGERVDLRDAPKALVDFVLKHADKAEGAAVPIVADVVHHASDFGLEEQIIQKMIDGKATSTGVLKVLTQSGTRMRDLQDWEERIGDASDNPRRTDLALELYGKKNNSHDELLAIHDFASRQGGPRAQARSLETLIHMGALGKEELRDLIDGVKDTQTANALFQKLAA